VQAQNFEREDKSFGCSWWSW